MHSLYHLPSSFVQNVSLFTSRILEIWGFCFLKEMNQLYPVKVSFLPLFPQCLQLSQGGTHKLSGCLNWISGMQQLPNLIWGCVSAFTIVGLKKKRLLRKHTAYWSSHITEVTSYPGSPCVPDSGSVGNHWRILLWAISLPYAPSPWTPSHLYPWLCLWFFTLVSTYINLCNKSPFILHLDWRLLPITLYSHLHRSIFAS